MVLDQDHRVVAVQRVISPADCTVSQSSLSLRQDGSEAQPNTALLPVVSYLPLFVMLEHQYFNINLISSVSDSEAYEYIHMYVKMPNYGFGFLKVTKHRLHLIF